MEEMSQDRRQTRNERKLGDLMSVRKQVIRMIEVMVSPTDHCRS